MVAGIAGVESPGGGVGGTPTVLTLPWPLSFRLGPLGVHCLAERGSETAGPPAWCRGSCCRLGPLGAKAGVRGTTPSYAIILPSVKHVVSSTRVCYTNAVPCPTHPYGTVDGQQGVAYADY